MGDPAALNLIFLYADMNKGLKNGVQQVSRMYSV